MRHIPILILLSAVCASGVHPQGLPEDSCVARVGDLCVSAGEFISRLNLYPVSGLESTAEHEATNLEILHSIVAEKLLAQEAVKSGFDHDGPLNDTVHDIRKLLARDELYRQEITRSALVSPSELARGIMRARKQLLVSFYFFQRENEARLVRERLKRPRDFETLQMDSMMSAGHDTATLVWGEGDPAVEEAAFRLSRGAISPVVAAGGGYYILKLVQERASRAAKTMRAEAFFESVKTTLKLRKERTRLAEFTKEFLADKVGYVVGRNLKGLVESIVWAARATSPDTMIMFTPALANAARSKYKFASTDSLIVIGGSVWTVSDVLDRLSGTSPFMPAGSAGAITATLQTRFRIWAQQELLADEALKRGLDAAPSVKRRVRMWKEFFLAELMKTHLEEKVLLPDDEVWDHLGTNEADARVPQVRIRELLSGSIDGINDALKEIEKGGSLDAVIRALSIEPEAKRTGGVTDFFPVTERFPLGDIASRMRPGDRFGPVATRSGVAYFELMERRNASPGDDTTTASRFAIARHQLLRRRQKQLVTEFLAQSARQRGFTVFEERVKTMTLSPASVTSYRNLGFGGNLFEAPFVEKQVDWLSVATPDTTNRPE